MTCTDCDQEMVHHFAEEHELGWETAHPPVICPDCGTTGVLTIDVNDAGEVGRIGAIMAQLCQAKRDGENAEHATGNHDEQPHPWCHHCGQQRSHEGEEPAAA